MNVTRRGFLKTTGAVAGSTMVVGTASAASGTPHIDSIPDDATITYDETWLNTYAPKIGISNISYSSRPELYGWKVESDSKDTDVGVYVAKYSSQRDVWTFTSHDGDREWIYVFVDENGDIESVSYTAYHWLRGYQLDPTVYTGDGGKHPVYKVDSDYHHYYPTTNKDIGSILDTKTLGDTSTRNGELYFWLDNGLSQDLRVGSVHNPWNMAHDGKYSDWWNRNGISSVNSVIVKAWATIGLYGHDTANFGDVR